MQRSGSPCWKAGRPARPQVTATLGVKAPSTLGHDGLLDFDLKVTLDGETLSAAEIQALLAGTGGLALVRGRWVEVDPERLRQALDHGHRAAAGGQRLAQMRSNKPGRAGNEDAQQAFLGEGGELLLGTSPKRCAHRIADDALRSFGAPRVTA